MKSLKYPLIFTGLYILVMSALLGSGEDRSPIPMASTAVQPMFIQGQPNSSSVMVAQVSVYKKEVITLQEANSGKDEESQGAKIAEMTRVEKVPAPAFDSGKASGSFVAQKNGIVHLEVFDCSGMSVLRRDMKVKKGKNAFHLRTDFILPGEYALVLKCDGKPYLHKFTKTNA